MRSLLVALIFLCGCAAQDFKTAVPPAEEIELLRTVDRAVAASDCRNQAYDQIPGFPHLRTSRFWQAIARQGLNRQQFAFWLDRLRENDREARRLELTCFGHDPGMVLPGEPGLVSGSRLNAIVEESAQRLADRDRQRPELLSGLAGISVPDDYSLLLRTLGLYPLSRIPIVFGVHDAYQTRRNWFDQKLEELVQTERIVAVGPTAPSEASAEQIAAILAESSSNPLKLPLPGPDQTRLLVEHFAPVFQQEVLAAVDQWGEVRLEKGTVEIGRKRVVYYYLDHQLVDGQPLMRINYVIWHAGRDGESVPWFERGWLDGITYGVVLDPQGSPLMISTMNNCGCYLQFYPKTGRVAEVIDKPYNPDVLVPQEHQLLLPGERTVVTITSGWHQVVRITATATPTEQQYLLKPYAALESLPLADGRTRNLFDERGIVVGTERAERFFFFGMGIPSVGSMRQRGHQPVTLLGREHYDDPNLLEANFRFSDF